MRWVFVGWIRIDGTRLTVHLASDAGLNIVEADSYTPIFSTFFQVFEFTVRQPLSYNSALGAATCTIRIESCWSA
jgi:hypothetical protein